MSAPRGRRPGFVMPEEHRRFYVYQFVVDGVVVYVGKGSGRRLEHQERRFGIAGEIVRRFKSERDAYDYEARLIERLKPAANKIAGGGGSISRRKARVSLPKWWRDQMKEIERVGSRVFVARALLKMDLRGWIEPSKVDMLRQVANGARG